ncbi:hypothetical protein IWW48_002810 [Coemansia sp. RSA 1200]|nr:hypothetical protein IWW48_002810 [Coemansia sp. RSA 1200]
MSTASNASASDALAQQHRIKVSNISRHVEREVVERLFSFVGEIIRLDVHQSSINPEVREAAVEFRDAASVRAALFLTGTEVADRALVITEDQGLPAAIAAAAPPVPASAAGAPVAVGGAHAMPLANAAVVAMMATRPRNLGTIPANVAAVIHPSILQFDPVKAEEISRTIYVGNIASWVGEQQLMDFFAVCGPVAYVKMAGDGMQPTRFAFVEFADVQTAQAALQMNGMMLADRPLKVNHSKNSINKPPPQQQQLGGGAGGFLAPGGGAGLHHPAALRMGGASSGALLGHSVPTLAAIASLPGSVDPVAASLLAANNTIQARLQAVRQQQNQVQQQQPGAGLAWPVLGSVNPLAQPAAAGAGAGAGAADDEQHIGRRIRELQTQMEDKYAAERSRRGSRREGRRSRSRRREDDGRDYYAARRSSRRRHRSPSAVRESSRRRRDDVSPPPPPPLPRSSSRRRSRSAHRSPSSRRSSRRRDADDDYYWRDRGSYARP